MNGRINFSDLIDKMAEKSDHSKNEIHDFLKGMVDVTRYGLAHDGRVNIGGVGIFDLRHQDARMGRNPQTGEELEIPEHYRVHYHPDASMRRFINRKFSHLKPRYLPVDKETPVLATSPAVAAPIDTYDHDEVESRDRKKHPIWLWGIIVALIVLLLFFILPLHDRTPSVVDTTDKEAVTPVPETASAVETEPVAAAPANVEPVSQTSEPVIPHTIEQGDRLWSLSDHYYENAYFWPYIYQANEDVIPNPDWLVPGVSIDVPPLASELDAMTDTQKDALADGYLKVYFNYHQRNIANAYTYLWTAEQIGGESIINANRDRIAKVDLARLNKMKAIKPVFKVNY